MISPLDRLSDIGDERMFLAVFREESAKSKPDAIPAGFKVTLNIQSVGAKTRVPVEFDRRAPLQTFMEAYCRKVGKSVNQYRFEFDGEKLNPTDTMEKADLEGDEVIDAYPV